jgi:hypothetical protein
MITSVDTGGLDGQSKYTTVYTTGASDFEYSIDGTYFLTVISFEYHQRIQGCGERQNGCGTVTDEVYLLM